MALPEDVEVSPQAKPEDHSVKILFCHVCGMQREFLGAKSFLEDEFPGLSVEGENYPIPPIIELLRMVLQGVQLLAVALIIFGDGFWTSVLRFRSVPAFYYKIKEYAFHSFVLIFFILPKLMNKYVTTGAFEMILDGVTVYSKLETGRMPNAGDLVAPLEAIGLLKSGKLG